MYKPRHNVTVLIFHKHSYYELRLKQVCGDFKINYQRWILRFSMQWGEPKVAVENHAKKLFSRFSDRHVRSNDIRYHLRLTHNSVFRHVVGIRVDEAEFSKLKKLSALRLVASGSDLSSFRLALKAVKEIRDLYGYRSCA